MGLRRNVDIEIKSSEVLSYMMHEIEMLKHVAPTKEVRAHSEKIALMKAESDRMRAENKGRELDIKEKDLEIKNRSVSLMEVEMKRFAEMKQQQETSEMIHIVDLQDRLASQESELRILIHQVTELTAKIETLV